MAVLQIITGNPYRVLGVTANAPMKERVANQGKMKAFLKVGKSVSFPLDLAQVLPEVNRTTESVAAANSQLTLPKDQIKFAQFWFVNVSSFDQIAINHLTNGDIDAAIEIWKKKLSVSTLHNLVVTCLIKGDYKEAIATAKRLYSSYSKEFAQMILGNDTSFDASSIGNDFIEHLAEEITPKKLLPFVADADWRQHLSASSVKPLIDALTNAVASAKASKGQGPAARYAAGAKLMNETKGQLKELKSLLPAGDLQYQMMADKLGLEILQCGIDYYNDSEDDDAARKAMVLQKYAQTVVVGQMAKDRCKENADILQKIIDKLPPAEVMAENRAIIKELEAYTKLPDRISHAVTLLKNTRPHLQSIKQKLGLTNTFYLRMSTQIVGNALHNIVEEVNAAQKDPQIAIRLQLGLGLDSSDLAKIKSVVREAWKATTLMDDFDLEAEFKSHYNKNRNTLKSMCNQIGIPIDESPEPPAPQPDERRDEKISTVEKLWLHIKSKDSTKWETALFLNLMGILVGYVVYKENPNTYFVIEDCNAFVGGTLIGMTSWICLLVDGFVDVEEIGDTLDVGDIASIGCGCLMMLLWLPFLFIMIPISVGIVAFIFIYVIYKATENLINVIKKL